MIQAIWPLIHCRPESGPDPQAAIRSPLLLAKAVFITGLSPHVFDWSHPDRST